MSGSTAGPGKVVVVGSGMAANRLVESLVSRGVDDITVLGGERHAPYNRILLSAVLEGTHSVDAITLRTPQWYAERGVDLRLDARVDRLDVEDRAVVLVDGTVVPYDTLVLATGSLPTLPPIRGLVRLDGRLHDRLHSFRHLDDCLRLSADVAGRLARAEATGGDVRAVVVGGGLLGLQVARALSIRGVLTEVVEGSEHLLRSHVGAPAGKILARNLKRLDTPVYTGARAVTFTDGAGGAGPDGPSDRRCGLKLDNGHTLETDLVVITAGVRPSVALARRAGLDVRRGLVVDDTLTTSDPAVRAIGDCAEHDGRTSGFVPSAWEQAELLAARLAGEDVRYDGSRVVARLRATDLDVAVLGEPEREVTAGGEVVEIANPIAGTHRRLVVRDHRIVAATMVGDLSRIGLITQLFDRRTVLAPHEPGDLLLGDAPVRPVVLTDEAEVCACAGVTAGRIRACSSLETVRETTRATTGCGGCAPTVRQLLAQRSTPGSTSTTAPTASARQSPEQIPESPESPESTEGNLR
ncbi:FAD-dependent oxidoreductase [Nocardioides sp.]|uniref:FAD-dependent oxidoreductase n=1 Tax=Nocardioides sp. TaxID=35761 RepID=UPI0026264A8C|nr:FAD-dependent oxidoreductase [Nocardioides sp.]